MSTSGVRISIMSAILNERAQRLVDAMVAMTSDLQIVVHDVAGARVIDCGVKASRAGLRAGLMLARCCIADLADVTLIPDVSGPVGVPQIQVVTDHPVMACMASQYAGWQIAVDLPPG